MAVTTFQQFIPEAFNNGSWATDEVVAFVLPLFEEVQSFHENGLVGPFQIPEAVFLVNGRLDIDETRTQAPRLNWKALKQVWAGQQVNGFTVTERILVEEDLGSNSTSISNRQVQHDPQAPITHPVYIPGYQSYEWKLEHHDVQTDIFSLGLILGSVATGLNLYEPEELERFVQFRNQPAALNERLHPTVCALITEMTALDRSERSRDLLDLVHRLKYYRDYDPQRQKDLAKEAILQVKQPAGRKAFILAKLRNRLFDTSRRNRLLYYKPNSRFVNLTISSVPAVLHYQSINPASLFTWNTAISKQIIGMKDLPLNKYLCFEDHPYLNAQLNGVRQEADSDEKEYGFSQLRLVIAFLHWHNLKEDAKERIQSPLLLLPVQLKRTKALKEEKFTLEIADNTAIINPVLGNYLKDLYGLQLPESIDLDEISMEAFYEALKAKIDEARQGVVLNYIHQPRISLIHSAAKQTIQHYRKRLRAKGSASFHQVEYSYSKENYKPLGLELFKQKIEPPQSSLSFLLGEKPAPGKRMRFAAETTALGTSFQLVEGESNPYSWDFDVCNIVLGNFNYKKMSLVSDYSKVADQDLAHPVFDELFNSQPRLHETPVIDVSPKHWHHVIAADPTQAKAILHSRTGKSYVIQGPPGTGKSQTITNLIADFLAQGKNVLFVCEKRAALDVVYHRLQQNKLAELCCYIHDSQGDKKEFIKDLKTVYDDFLQHPMDLHSVSLHRKAALERLEEQLQLLEAYHQQQTALLPEAGVSMRALLETALRLKPVIAEMPASTPVPAYSEWQQFGQVIAQLSAALEQSGAGPQLASHAFANLGNPVMQAENPFILLDSLSGHSMTIINQLAQLIAQHNVPVQHTGKLSSISNLLQDAAILAPLAHHRNLQLVDPSTPEAREFETAYRQYQQLQQEYQQATTANSYWQHKFSKQETQQALEIARKYEQSFFGFLSGSWRRLKKQLKKAYSFSSHQLPPTFSTVLLQLQEEYDAQERISRKQQAIQQQYGVDNINTIYVGIDVLRRKQGDAAVDYLLQHPQANELVIQLSKLNNALHQLEIQLKQCLYSYDTKSLDQIRDELDAISGNADVLKELLPALRRFAALPADLQELIRKVPLTPQQAEAVMAHKTLTLLLNRNPTFAQTSHWNLKDAAKEISEIYARLLQLNSDYIRASRRHDFLNNYTLSNTSVTQLTPEQRAFKKEYTEGRRILEHEMGKSKQYKSIRTLASNESGRVLKDLKPVWLMSPLSVSDSLPLNLTYFDVVIFDEASQITLEEGVPALFRAPQTIIVGDDKQMPPSNFFNAKGDDPNDLETFDGESEDEILSAEADSLLVQGARKLYNTMLQWHYRSRYETLISYSNHAFYGADLLTIPDRTIYHNNKAGIEIQQPEEGAKTAKHLLNNSMSFHYLPTSVYAERGNGNEAKYIAVMVRELLLQQVEESIGIVAFSQEQQSVITDALEALADLDKNFDALLEKAYNRKEQGQFTGLFIKNLENVQGDERDIIIMSVCYGHDSRGKMLMNFGPINRKGGEKRLNVIFSRAKKHMAIVSSIKHHHITNDYNEGPGYLKRFLHYAEMVSTGNIEQARLILDSLAAGDQQKKEQTKARFSIATAEIKSALETAGYVLGEAIGQSSFKCSLAVKKNSSDTEYSVGIMVDDDLHYRNNDVIEQYYQRPAILESFGWKIINVYAKDWLEDKEAILATILRELKDKAATTPAIPPAATGQQPSLPQQQLPIPAPGIIELISADGERFWELGRAGSRITMRFGRAGTKGQMQIRTYLHEAEAIASMEQLVADQKKQGFLPAGGYTSQP